MLPFYLTGNVCLRTLCFILAALLLQATIVSAQDFPRDEKSARLLSVNSLEPPTSDETFVGTTGGNYDSYLYRKNVPNGRLNLNVDVTRFYSGLMRFDAQGFLTNAPDLIQRGLLPKMARITLRVYDIDHNSQYDGNGDGIADPEVDYAYVNGKLVTSDSGEPRTLGSGNNTWSTPSFMVPIDYIKFPQQAGTATTGPKATNLIQIEVDVPNTGYWAVECDWVSINIENQVRPFVLVRGFGRLGSNGAVAAEETWRTFIALMATDGLPNQLAAIDVCGHIAANADVVADAVATAKVRFGVSKINILAHSKGGLDTRAYIRSGSDIEHLVQIGTPNHGSGLSTIGGLGCDAGDDLDPDWIANTFNYTNKNKSLKLYETERDKGTRISLLIGTDDGVVATNRATLPWNAVYRRTYLFGSIETEDLTDPTNIVNDGSFPLGHSALHEQVGVYQAAIWRINPKLTIQGRKGGRVGVFEPEPSLSVTAADTIASVFIQRGQLVAGAAQTYRFYVPQTGIGYTQNIIGDDKTTLSFKTPSGKTYTTTDFTRDEAPGGYLYSRQFEAIEAGTWSVTVQAGTAATAYYLKVGAPSAKQLAIGTEKFSYAPKEAIVINARFTQKGAPITQARGVVYVYRGTVSDSLQLFDDGSHSDVKANDGIYGNTLAGITEPGRVYLIAKLQKDAESVYDEASVNVTISSAEFANTYREAVLDKNGDGLYDSLQVKVGFKVKIAGNYMITGSLKDAQGKLIGTATWSNSRTKTLPVGTFDAILNFDGQRISANGVSGVYTLDDLVLMDNSKSAIVDTRQKAYTTRSYNALFFSQPPIALTGKNSETPIDSDKDGDYDYLDIKVQVKVSIAGLYSISAELIDSLQNSLTWADKSLSLSIGQNDITLRFTGDEINEKLAKGRFTLTNLYFNSSAVSITFYDVYKTAAYTYADFTGNILSGTVKDRFTNTPVVDATIVLKGAKLATVKTDSRGGYTIAGLPNGAYTVEARKDNYCSSAITTLSKVQSNTTVDLIVMNRKLKLGDKKLVQLCPGDSLRLVMPAGWQTYKWTTGATSISLIARNSDIYSASAAYQTCQAQSDTVTIARIDVQKPTISTDGVITMTASQAESYQWFKDGQAVTNATSQTYTATTSGKYTVLALLKTCSLLSDPYNLVITAIEPAPSFAVSVYPNPNTGQFWVESSQTQLPWQLTIYNTQGQQVFAKWHNDPQNTRELVSLIPVTGVYTLRVTTGTTVRQTVRFLIE